MSATTSTSDVIAKHKALFGETAYTYDKVAYRGKRSSFTLTCRVHGDFEVKGPLSKMSSWGKCKQCKVEERASTLQKKYTELHSGRYDYSKVNFSLSKREKVEIVCRKHNKSFFQSLDHHTKHGCPDCGNESAAASSTGVLKYSTEEYIEACKDLPTDYDYSNTVYCGAEAPIKVMCKIHNEVFTCSTAIGHRLGESKCPLCSAESRGFNAGRCDTSTFIDKAMAVHGDLYDYSNTVYGTSNKIKVVITCQEHGDFLITPNKHISKGQGCPDCANGGGFKESKPGYLYYLKVTADSGQVLYKIGITNRSVNERFTLTELTKIEVIYTKLYQSGVTARSKETEMLRKGKSYRYTGAAVLDSGNTELFTEDVVDIFGVREELFGRVETTVT